jgi:hypothetical protein
VVIACWMNAFSRADVTISSSVMGFSRQKEWRWIGTPLRRLWGSGGSVVYTISPLKASGADPFEIHIDVRYRRWRKRERGRRP